MYICLLKLIDDMNLKFGILNKLITFSDGKFNYNWEEIVRIPEFQALMATEQSDKWHREGTAWVHTGLVCEAALSKVTEKILYANEENAMIFLAAALFHDIGKGACTRIGKDGKPHSYGHDIIGSRIARRVLWDIDIIIREKICSLVKWHMAPLCVFENKRYLKDILEIVNTGVDTEMLSDLKRCDNTGSITYEGYDRNKDAKKVDFFELCCRQMKPVSDEIGPDWALPWQKEPETVFDAYGIMMIGLPGSGKDTFINRYYQNKDGDDRYVYLSRDDIRAEIGLCKPGEKVLGNEEEEERITKIFNKRLVRALDDHDVPIINCMNQSTKRRNAIKNTAGRGVRWIYIYLQAETLKENMERRKDEISEDKFKGIIESVDFPNPNECDELRIYISSNGNFTQLI